MIHMSLADAIFILGLALIIFGPRLLPKIDRQMMRPASLSVMRGYCKQLLAPISRKTFRRQDKLTSKLVVVFRRTSDEFKRRIEDEMRATAPTTPRKHVFKSESELRGGNRTESHHD
jgi:Sec-independent protein translocase protein TatA